MTSARYLVVGANRGIGLEFVRQLLQNPHNSIVATYRDPRKLDSLESLVSEKANHGRLNLVRMDMSDSESCKAAAAEVGSNVGGLDVLIVNAGIFIGNTPLLVQDPDEVLGIIGTNVIGPLRICQSFAPLLKSSNPAKLVLISSESGSMTLQKNERSPSYSISKAALNMMGRKLAHEFESSNVAVGIFHPGWVQTDMGGPDASITPQESVSGMMKLLEKLNLSNSGGYWAYSGEKMPW